MTTVLWCSTSYVILAKLGKLFDDFFEYLSWKIKVTIGFENFISNKLLTSIDFHLWYPRSYFSFPRESLFQPIFRNKVTQSPLPAGVRFSTFGYSDSSTPSPPSLPPGLSKFPSSNSRENSSCQHHPHHHHYRNLLSTSLSQTSEGSDNSSGMGTTNASDRQKRFIIKKDEATSTAGMGNQQQEQQQVMSSEMRKSAPDVVIISGCS